MFEVAKTDGVYSSKLTVLASFDGLNGSDPIAGLVATRRETYSVRPPRAVSTAMAKYSRSPTAAS